jgi:hypothetical protein
MATGNWEVHWVAIEVGRLLMQSLGNTDPLKGLTEDGKQHQ